MGRLRWSSALVFALALMQGLAANAETVFTHRAPETDSDTRPNYEVALLRLALEKTVDEYGPFRLQPSPPINITRSLFSIRNNTFPNFFYSITYQEAFTETKVMDYVRFPIDLGLLGYRTCFIPHEIKSKIANIHTLAELKTLSIGQGRGWGDVAILRANGFNVVEVDQYDTLFKMVAAHRFDLFCRGATEVRDEYNRWHLQEGFDYDRHILIYYPMPIFLYTNKANKEAIARVTKGLQIAYNDGSLYQLWAKHHLESSSFAELDKREIFRLENPMIQSVDKSYEKYTLKIGRANSENNAKK